jgi:hypothetical protein
MKGMDKITTTFASLDIFKCDVVLIICKPEHLLHAVSKFLSKERLEKFKKMLPEDMDSPSREGSNYPIMGGGSIIWCSPTAKPSVLIHEIAHALFYALRASDVPFSSDTEEVYAYGMENLYKQFFEPKKKKDR